MMRLSLSSIEPPPKAKSKAYQIAELLPEIEAALSAGHSHQAIFEQVKNTTGLDLTFGYYENTIHRIRHRQDAKSRANSASPASPKIKQPPQTVSPLTAIRSVDAPTSKLQAALGEDVGDFFS
jgi:hypothetical protein